jgi:Cobalt transport protein
VSVVAPSSSRFAALQYKPGRTLLHLLDARTKLLATAIAIAGVLITPQPVGYLALLVLLACATAAARVGPALFWRAFGLLLIMVAISGVITVIIWPGPAAFHVGPLRISRPGIDLAMRGTTQFFVILYTSALMTMTTAPSALGHALIWYLSPLRRLRVPVDDIGVMVSLGLAFLPLLQQELQRILLAQGVAPSKCACAMRWPCCPRCWWATCAGPRSWRWRWRPGATSPARPAPSSRPAISAATTSSPSLPRCCAPPSPSGSSRNP